MAGGQSGLPNGFRFGYLTTVTAVAAAAGVLQLTSLAAPSRARASALLAVGLLAVSGVLGIRDSLLVWPEHRATFDSFHGEDTLLGDAAARWDRYGRVSIDTARPVGFDDRHGEAVPARRRALSQTAARGARAFRLVHPGTVAAAGQRVVEQVRDRWGRQWAIVLGGARNAMSAEGSPRFARACGIDRRPRDRVRRGRRHGAPAASRPAHRRRAFLGALPARSRSGCGVSRGRGRRSRGGSRRGVPTLENPRDGADRSHLRPRCSGSTCRRRAGTGRRPEIGGAFVACPNGSGSTTSP